MLRRMRLSVLTAGLLLAVSLMWFSSPQVNSQTRAEWEWTNKEFASLLDALMPLQSNSGVFVAYRANRDFVTSTPEYWFTIGREPSESQSGLRPYLSAHVRVAQPVSIYSQIMAIHHAEPSTTDNAVIKNKIRLQRADLTEMRCPAVKSQLEKLKNIAPKLPDISGDYIIIHPMNHSFHVSGANGDVTMTLTDEKDALVQWAQETRQAFDACAKPH